jgi:pyruvate/2-oxoglutarate dehydrogenase complex dihydrolipoamide acyltransferase (E2) component
MATPITMLRLSKGMEVGRVVTWRKAVGETISPGDILLEVETDKSIVEVEAPAAGALLAIMVTEGKEVPVGTALGWLGEPGETPPAPSADAHQAPSGGAAGRTVQATPVAGSGVSSGGGGKVRATPSVRRLASQHGIALESLANCEDGRISRADVEAAIQAQTQAPRSGEPTGDFESLPLEGIRKVMAQRMAHSTVTNAAATTFVDVDMHAAAQLKKNQSVTYTSIVVKAVGLALPKHKMLNASLDGDNILLHRPVNVAVAVDSPAGLIVVTIAAVDGKSLSEVDSDLRQLSADAKQGATKARDLTPSTFTVSNSGVLGSLAFTPIINPPQSGILGIGKIQDTPVVRDGQIVIRPVMYLALTYDHRIVTGSEAVGFLQEIKQTLKDTAAMI